MIQNFLMPNTTLRALGGEMGESGFYLVLGQFSQLLRVVDWNPPAYTILASLRKTLEFCRRGCGGETCSSSEKGPRARQAGGRALGPAQDIVPD